MGQQPSIPTDLSREVRVIGAGFSRTGTVSFALALERLLDGPVCHSGTAVLPREEEYVKKWIKIQRPNVPQKTIETTLRDLTAGYVATTDTPMIQYTEELTRLYPKAIVICTTRERSEWFKSSEALNKNTGLWWLDYVFWPMPTLRWFGVWRDTIGDRLEKIYGTSRKNVGGPELLTLHEDYLRRVVPPSRLHFFNVKEGWAPLCKILDCPIPDEPFPRANDGKAMQEFFERILRAALMRWLQIFLGLVSCLGRGGGVWVWAGVGGGE